MEVLMGEEAEWSASTTTLPLDETSPRSAEDEEKDDDDDEEEEEEEEEEDGVWAVERPEQRSRKGLRALLLEMDVDDKTPRTRRTQQQQAEDDSGEEEEEEKGVAAHVELRHAEERVRVLEARLLDAEETIYHLKAEKMEAWRRVERLTRLHSGGGAEGTVDSGEGGGGEEEEAVVLELRSQVHDLEDQLEDLKTQHAVEREQQMDVIREQERELLVLNERLTELKDHADDMQHRYEQLLTRHQQLEYEQKEEEETADDPVKMAPSDTSLLRWREELLRHPTPHFDLDSPEVQYLLTSWTSNAKKLQYIRTWLISVATQHDRDLPMDFPTGIELPRLAPEIRDGFLTLVVPLLRKQPWREIQVHTKQYNDGYHTDLRIRVESRRP